MTNERELEIQGLIYNLRCALDKLDVQTFGRNGHSKIAPQKALNKVRALCRDVAAQADEIERKLIEDDE